MDHQFTLDLTVGVFRDIVSGRVCTSKSETKGRFTFFFELFADMDDGCNTAKRKIHLSVKCRAFIGKNSPWSCSLKMGDVNSTVPPIHIDKEIKFTNEVDSHKSHFCNVADATAVTGSLTIGIPFSIVEVSEQRFLVNNFQNDMNGINSFEFTVDKDKVKLYGNENFLKFHSSNICDSPNLADVDAHQFHDFLELLYDRDSMISETNVSYILSLAKRFKVAKLLDLGEKFLLDSIKVTHKTSWFHNVLKWSCIYDLVNLRFEAVKKFKTVEQYGNFMKEQDYKTLEDNHKLLLNQQVLIELKA
ncbi:unnamed protein product [Auanema sp. JU1783]|nr:unnamed protein product [Auanema sp. JU1783]